MLPHHSTLFARCCLEQRRRFLACQGPDWTFELLVSGADNVHPCRQISELGSLQALTNEQQYENGRSAADWSNAGGSGESFRESTRIGRGHNASDARCSKSCYSHDWGQT